MKNLKIWSLALALCVAMVGCTEPAAEEQNGPVINAPFTDVATAQLAEKLVNTWHLVEYAGQAAQFDVYIEFTADNAFDLYERVYGYEYLYNAGTYTLEGNKLTGAYADGAEWNNKYTIKISKEAPIRLRLIEANGAYAEYVGGEAIPDYVKAAKSVENEPEQASTRANSYFL